MKVEAYTRHREARTPDLCVRNVNNMLQLFNLYGSNKYISQYVG